MIDVQEEQTPAEDVKFRMYTTAQMIEALGIKEARFYELKKKYRLFQEKGVADGRNIVFGQDILDRYKAELATFTELREHSKEEEAPPKQELITLAQEERVVQMITLSHKEIQPEPLHTLDPIEQAIITLQKSKQQIFEQQEMVNAVRAIRERHRELLKDMDALLERWD